MPALWAFSVFFRVICYPPSKKKLLIIKDFFIMARTTAHSGQRSNHFSMVPRVNIRRSLFNRSNGFKTTMNSGFLVPFFCDEVLPGDTFKLSTSIFARLNTPVTPFFDNVWIDTHFFFVPSRLVWSNFQKFMGEQENPGDSTDYLVPQITVTPQIESIFDYFGLPYNKSCTVSALPFRAYNLIYNEWFRDENLIDSVPVPKGDEDNANNYKLLRRGKRHDYFTSALPWPQKGPAVEVGLSGNAPVNFDGSYFNITEGVGDTTWQLGGSSSQKTLELFNFRKLGSDSFIDLHASDTNGNWYPVGGSYQTGGSGDGGSQNNQTSFNGLRGDGELRFNEVYLRPDSSYRQPYVDLSGVNAISINDLRQAFQIQKFYEARARSGSRYTEILRGFFGVVSPDARLQRPEYLGGSSDRLNVVPVAQNSSTSSVSPQGNLSAFGVSANVNRGFNKSFVEHGFVIGLISIRADLNYQQGLDRMWSRKSLFDFYWPQFAHLGEQAILNKEIYLQGTDADNQVFGYQERYADYRYKPSRITGKLRSTYEQSLDVWHLAQKFDNLPTLSKDFIEENPPINRVVAVPSEPQFLLDCWFNLTCARPMPVFGVPGLIDHF